MREWIAAGQAYGLFWSLTLREISVVFRGIAERERREGVRQRAMVYAMARLTSVAVFDPKQLPDATEFIEGKPKEYRFASNEQIGAYFQALAQSENKRKS